MVESIVKSFEEITYKPEQFISSEDNLITNIRKTLKSSYDFSKKEEANNKSDALPELIIQNFDLEQIWQQLELQNDCILKRNVGLISKLIVHKNNLVFNYEEKEESDDDEVDEGDQDEQEEAEEDEADENEKDIEVDDVFKTQFKSSVLDDNFFKLDEMNQFLLSQEKETSNNKNQSAEDSESEESVDIFQANSDDDSDEDPNAYNNKKNPRYKDFFDNQSQNMQDETGEHYEDMEHSGQYNEDDYNYKHEDDNRMYSEQQSTNNIQSALELREERLKSKIEELEDAAVGEKPWQLKGEILAENRPINSLLEEVLEYDIGSRPAPVITEATTLLLEDVIRQRIKDRAFDDVERKQKPVDTPLEYKKKLVLDQEKSKESLAQIYEKEFLQQQQAVQGNNEEKEEETPQLHKDITSMMNSLFSKLDALSNFHFTPKPAAPELKIISNLPAINMEEVAPVAMTNASLLAPEEVKTRTKGDVIGENERSTTDKKRERRKKKLKQRVHAKANSKNIAKITKPGLGNKYTKEKVKKILDQVSKEKNVDKMDESYGSKGIKSSKAFFTQLQEEATSQIKNKMKVQKKKDKKVHNAKKLKL